MSKSVHHVRASGAATRKRCLSKDPHTTSGVSRVQLTALLSMNSRFPSKEASPAVSTNNAPPCNNYGTRRSPTTFNEIFIVKQLSSKYINTAVHTYNTPTVPLHSDKTGAMHEIIVELYFRKHLRKKKKNVAIARHRGGKCC